MFGAKNKEALVKDPEIKENISSTSNDACLTSSAPEPRSPAP